MGCVDAVPFIPIRGTTVEEADALAKEVATEAAEKLVSRSSYEDSAKV